MKHVLVRRATAAVLPLALIASAFAMPAMAQEFPADPGQFWDVTGIELKDGGGFAYVKWLAAEWKKDQEFAKSKGWITGYKVLSNLHARDGEPDLYLVTMYDDMPNGAESIQQRKEYFEWQSKSVARLNEESGNRLEIRRVMGTSMLQVLQLK
ncbi:hypothetical protein [Sphingorhabdus sp. Alg239-R122]|uniref:hypothetical protein n=1 Tax=Sphingorhabdus sp. Alg239-R122 TaxID=2305989 RepID=UPI0013D9C21B|nr:hypothetical protein [Sphingorhabdus sp. Alg239-R122]